MKTLQFTAKAADMTPIMEATLHDSQGRPYWSFTKTFKNPDIAPVEAVILEIEEDGDDVHIVCLMSDDHSARLAVSDDAIGIWWE